ncbi:BSP-domain-containing protein [Annulohypoxylon maeteangense]|uniref:BSP-domain-containing protein n=1 Tax=Annulohypoxylon maeteangense TaxID=1927788 RepID=UPI0020089689|nr:BSP-domain-containing protein [Annulohypoxylon maeteangense]KAI0882771.1 BSP-domain-containing protein [Annulohypoxylon maeteangense]
MSQSDPSNIPSSTDNIHIHLAISQDQDRKSTSSTMTVPPETTPVPPSVFTPGTSPRTDEPKPTPTSTAIPIPIPPTAKPAPENEGNSTKPLALPRLRFHVEDLTHTGSAVFLSSVQAPAVLTTSIESIHKHLYDISLSSPTTTTTISSHPPKPRVITLFLRDIPGVAYTTSSDLDPAHKEIHFSLSYIASIASSRQAHEITGVLLHELVHCYQWAAQGSAPGGLIEGIADWVRLRCDLAPPTWKQDNVPEKWDVGYSGTAYFLDYLERRFGDGTVLRVNEKLGKEKTYKEKAFWTELVGRPVEQLFEDYKETLPKKGEDEGKK